MGCTRTILTSGAAGSRPDGGGRWSWRGPGLVRPVALAAVLLSAGLLGACGSSTAASGSNAAVQGTCQQVSAVLSDGPDPDADPVGYAEAQVLPLRQIHTSDHDLQTAVDGLAQAYEHIYQTNGAPSAKGELKAAGDKINAICPGVVS